MTKYKVKTIPAAMLVNNEGEVVEMDARNKIEVNDMKNTFVYECIFV